MAFKELEQEQFIGYWCKTKGITKKDLESHPHIDDVILLMKYRAECWHRLNKSEQAVWGAIWGIIYKKRKPLTNKGLKKLELIYTNSKQRHLQQLIKIHTIKALRQNPYEKEDHDMTAKGSSNANNIPWELV